MNGANGFFWCVGAALLVSAGAFLVFQRIWQRRFLALKQELERISEDLLQMADLQMDAYRRVSRNINDIESRVLDLSVPSQEAPLPLERRHQVLTLARKGVPVDEISRRLNIPKGEAELILNLRKYNEAKDAPVRSHGAVRGYAQA